MKTGILLILVLTFCIGCKEDAETIERWTVASTILNNPIHDNWQEWESLQYYWVKVEDSKNWEVQSCRELKGFKYEEGYEYIITVSVQVVDNPPVDGSTVLYVYKNTISKVKKNSENIPGFQQSIYTKESTT